ncbi:hypothetical protein B0H13DRAFT_2439462 [Mycena leptocephala]|nr:hypothetical protein B0H13DRAFT_2439462 [Mycena leptocephala]
MVVFLFRFRPHSDGTLGPFSGQFRPHKDRTSFEKVYERGKELTAPHHSAAASTPGPAPVAVTLSIRSRRLEYSTRAGRIAPRLAYCLCSRAAPLSESRCAYGRPGDTRIASSSSAGPSGSRAADASGVCTHCVQAARRQRLCLPPAAELGRSGGRQTMPTSAQLPRLQILVSMGHRLNMNLTITIVGVVGTRMFSVTSLPTI